jgi:hypothetical protein
MNDIDAINVADSETGFATIAVAAGDALAR